MMQYYLFINYYLEEIKQDEILKKKVSEEIYKIYNIKINFDKLILKIYKLAFDHSGNKHRDFPYFNFYDFLNGLSLKNLELLETNIDKFQLELYDIYNNVYKAKKKKYDRERFNTDLKLSSSTPTFPTRSFSIGGIMNKNEKLKNPTPK